MSLHSNLIKLATQPWTGNGVTSITTPVSSGISLSDTVNDVEIENTGIKSITAGANVSVTTTNGVAIVAATGGGSSGTAPITGTYTIPTTSTALQISAPGCLSTSLVMVTPWFPNPVQGNQENCVSNLYPLTNQFYIAFRHPCSANTKINYVIYGGGAPPAAPGAAVQLLNTIDGQTMIATWTNTGSPDFTAVNVQQSDIGRNEWSFYTGGSIYNSTQADFFGLPVGYDYRFYCVSYFQTGMFTSVYSNIQTVYFT
jgi:hypothetical protein